MARYLPQRLKLILNTWTLRELPAWSAAPALDDPDVAVAAILSAGYSGLQMAPGDRLMPAARRAGALLHATGRIVDPARALAVLDQHQDCGFSVSTVHLGTGFESREQGYALAEALLEAAERLRHPVYVETHRATLTQDPHRTLELLERYPSLRINGDFSHWYAGCEMRYGDWHSKLATLRPVFERTRYLHGRIADSGALQVAVRGRRAQHVADFMEMWTRAMAGFMATADARQDLYFAPELLPHKTTVGGVLVYPAYARQRPNASGVMEDDSDRWEQALALSEIAIDCFSAVEAQAEAQALAKPAALH